MEVVLLHWGVQLVPSFPSQVSLVLLFPKEEIFKVFVIPSVSYKMSMTEIESCGKDSCFKRLCYFLIIQLQWTRTWDIHLRVTSELKPSHNWNAIERISKIYFTVTISIVGHSKAIWVD